MVTTALYLVYATFALLVGLCICTIAMAFALKRRFANEWKYWGEPNEWLFLQRTSLDRHVFTFLQERAYTRTGDKSFIRFCEAIRVGWYLGLALLPVTIMVFGIALAARP